MATNIDTLFEEITEKILNEQQLKTDKAIKSSATGENNEPEEEKRGENIKKLME